MVRRTNPDGTTSPLVTIQPDGSVIPNTPSSQQNWQQQNTNYSQPYIPNSPSQGGNAYPNQVRPVVFGQEIQAPDANEYDWQPRDPKTMESFNMWRTLSQQQGPTQYGREAVNQINQNKNTMLGKLPNQAQQQLGNVTSGLAMRGGLRGGMENRLGQNAQNQQMLAKQGVYRQSQNSILDALKNDEALKVQAGEQWGDAESDYAMDAQKAQQRKYQLDLGKWAAGVGSEAYKTIMK